MADSPTRRVTLRVPASLHADLTRLASRRETSVNQLVLDALAREVERVEEEELIVGFDALADEEEECSVEMYFAAQAEVVLRDE